MISPEAIFFSITMCASQGILIKDPNVNPFDNPVCKASSETIMAGGEIQQGLNKANHLYLDPLPEDIKKAGAVGLFYYKQRLRFAIYRGLSIDMQFVRTNTFNEEMASQFITYHLDFP